MSTSTPHVQTMKQAIIRTPTSFEVQEVAIPRIQNNHELLLKTAASGICSGDLMEWYLEKKVGTVLGHEVVGYAVEVGSECQHIAPGDLVFCHHHAPCGNCRFCRAEDPVHCPQWRSSKLDPGGMSEYIRVPAINAQQDSFSISDLSPEVGVFIEPLACSVKAIQRIPDGPRDLGIVVGCGVMGLLNILAAKALGTQTIWAVDPDSTRLSIASRVGADAVFSPEMMLQSIQTDKLDPADYAIVGPGIPSVLSGATKYVRNGGTIIQFTPTPFGQTTALDLSEMYLREVALIASYSCGPRETRTAYELLRTNRIDISPLITHRFQIDEIQSAYNLAKQGGAVLKVLVTFPETSKE